MAVFNCGRNLFGMKYSRQGGTQRTMSLRFVIGRSGAGKTYTVSRELLERSCKHPEKQFLVKGTGTDRQAEP